MSHYTTGDMARLCQVSVRTVQFYDAKDLLKPTALTEGGRRLYTDADLQKLQLICLLKSLGLSLDSIKGILASQAPHKILLLLLEEQAKELTRDIGDKQQQLQAIQIVKDSLLTATSDTIPVQSVGDIERMMKEKNSRKKLKKVHGIMIAVGIVMDIIQLYTLYLWIFRGLWVPFAIGMPLVILMAVIMVRLYHKHTAYICPACDKIFQPTIKAMFWARHTPKTRKLTCPHCGKVEYCIAISNEK